MGDGTAVGVVGWKAVDREQRALERIGLVREGVLREVAFRDGAWRDCVLYSLLRDQPRGEVVS